MLEYALLGMLVAGASFACLELIVYRFADGFTPPTFVLMVVFGLHAADLFAEPADSIYSLGYLFGLGVCILFFIYRKVLSPTALAKRKPPRVP